MAPNKKKKKPVSHPARGFATVSTPSKKADESPQEPKDNPEAPSTDGKPMNATTRLHDHGGPEDVASEVRHMTPEELERHLEEAELQSLLDVHGQSSKNDVGRQKARLEAERRNLRRGGMMLETESWLSPVMEEVLELGRSSEDLVPTKKSGEHLDDTDLCVKLWTVQQTLDSLHFRNIDGALKHLIRMSSVLPKPYSSSLIWGLDEALNWLARWSEPEDLPAYDHQNLRSIPTSRPSSPPSAYASGETIDASDSPTNTFYSCSTSTDDANPSASSSTPENHAENEASVTTNTVSDDSDDNDPDQLVDKFLSAKYELLKDSLDSKANQQEQRLSEQQCLRLKRRIERIERDILFEQEDAMGRWEALRNDLEIEHARSKALNMRQKRATKTRVSTDIAAPAVDAEYIQQNENDEVGEDLFGSIFASNDNTDLDTSEVAAQTVTLRDFSPAGVGASPSRVLEDVCKARYVQLCIQSTSQHVLSGSRARKHFGTSEA